MPTEGESRADGHQDTGSSHDIQLRLAPKSNNKAHGLAFSVRVTEKSPVSVCAPVTLALSEWVNPLAEAETEILAEPTATAVNVPLTGSTVHTPGLSEAKESVAATGTPVCKSMVATEDVPPPPTLMVTVLPM